MCFLVFFGVGVLCARCYGSGWSIEGYMCFLLCVLGCCYVVLGSCYGALVSVVL